MLGGTLPVPLYVLYERQMGFGPLGVAVVFAAYVLGTLFALVALGDLSGHTGRRTVLGGLPGHLRAGACRVPAFSSPPRSARRCRPGCRAAAA
jgi:hypothetical protein